MQQQGCNPSPASRPLTVSAVFNGGNMEALLPGTDPGFGWLNAFPPLLELV